ncbi:MAG: (Fe-S)-binding protein [Desulfatiglandales bacterium]
MRVFLLDTCILSHLYPRVLRDICDLLKRLGVKPVIPDGLGCCGLPAYNSGHWEIARSMAKRLLKLFAREEIPIVVPSGSCAAMIRVHYLKLFGDDPYWLNRAGPIAERTYELSQFLVQKIGPDEIRGRYEARVAFHDSCQALRSLNIFGEPTILLNQIQGVLPAGIDFRVEGGEGCCGFGGFFHLKYPEISAAMRESKLKKLLEASPDIVVGLDMGCLYNLKKGLSKGDRRIRFLHLGEFLREAMAKYGRG